MNCIKYNTSSPSNYIHFLENEIVDISNNKIINCLVLEQNVELEDTNILFRKYGIKTVKKYPNSLGISKSKIFKINNKYFLKLYTFKNKRDPIYKEILIYLHIKRLINIWKRTYNNIYYGIMDTYLSIKFTNIDEKYYGIITHDINGKMLSSELINSLDTKQQKLIYFQIIYSLYILNIKFKIIHFDVGFHNIIIKKNTTSIFKSFVIEGIVYEKELEYDLRIFDFDHGIFLI